MNAVLRVERTTLRGPDGGHPVDWHYHLYDEDGNRLADDGGSGSKQQAIQRAQHAAAWRGVTIVNLAAVERRGGR
jgi:hypothetical protein